MKNVRKFPAGGIRKLEGGKDPRKLVEEVISRLGHDPEQCRRNALLDTEMWVVPLPDENDEAVEFFLEGVKKPSEASVYIGAQVYMVPLIGSMQVLVRALEIADGLVGVKLSLVGYSLVLSATLPASGLSVDELEYHYRLVLAQRGWFLEMLSGELEQEIYE